MKLEELNIEQIMKKLEEDEVVANELDKKRSVLAQEQTRIFSEYLKKLLPALEFIKNKGYYFKHPVIDYVSQGGPILDYNRDENCLFVYNLSEKRVKQFSLYNNKEAGTVVLNHHFFMAHDFETALQGLLHPLNVQAEFIKDCQKEIDKRESLIEQYKNL
ncbi:hypothetical protein AM501_27380 [Aneurinibacillus migulanus]|uniref:hypothetical protein n=1 Tax=Aneurinibacillus migulanus TaxID=47500 RepID=UPI0005BCF8E0|nr:hypothetical protein [Aneurinibacillus migulanus]KIV56937.1 hypothetical protein TS64_07795 [Aneurinibacillus migulanus]KPD05283.1 hypothetical protein AM501_27380 [Aneurinibacillus migulanus]